MNRRKRRLANMLVRCNGKHTIIHSIFFISSEPLSWSPLASRENGGILNLGRGSWFSSSLLLHQRPHEKCPYVIERWITFSSLKITYIYIWEIIDQSKPWTKFKIKHLTWTRELLKKLLSKSKLGTQSRIILMLHAVIYFLSGNESVRETDIFL